MKTPLQSIGLSSPTKAPITAPTIKPHRFLRAATALKAGLLCAAIAASVTRSSATALVPIATTGHDQDIVLEIGITGANTSEIGSRRFYELGFPGTGLFGLPRTLPTFTSITNAGDTISFTFAPFEGKNILKFDSSTGVAVVKTLTVTSPVACTKLGIVLSGGSLSAVVGVLSYTIHYACGGTQTGTLNVSDWGVLSLLRVSRK